MITTCKQFEQTGNLLYARIHTHDEELVRGKKYPVGTVECIFRDKPTSTDKRLAKRWVMSQLGEEATGFLKKRPEFAEQLRYVYVVGLYKPLVGAQLAEWRVAQQAKAEEGKS